MNHNPRGFSSSISVVLSALLFVSLMLWPSDILQASIGTKVPDISSPVWINTEPLSIHSLAGRVILVEFWTFGCYNCRNVEPQIKEWHRRYATQGLTVIAIHSPEFSFEKNVQAVQTYVEKNSIHYAVAIDNEMINWKRFRNRYWPAIYLVDKTGIIRYIRIGEGGALKTKQMIETLLAE